MPQIIPIAWTLTTIVLTLLILVIINLSKNTTLSSKNSPNLKNNLNTINW